MWGGKCVGERCLTATVAVTMREKTIRHLLKVWGKCVGERCLTATVAVMMKEEKITWTLLKVCVGKCVGERRGRMDGGPGSYSGNDDEVGQGHLASDDSAGKGGLM